MVLFGKPMKKNRTETVQPRKGSFAKKRASEKLLIYASLLTLNQEFEQVLETLERLKQLRLLRPRLRREFIRACRVTIERDTRLGKLRADPHPPGHRREGLESFRAPAPPDGRRGRRSGGKERMKYKRQEAADKKHRPQGRKAAGRR